MSFHRESGVCGDSDTFDSSPEGSEMGDADISISNRFAALGIAAGITAHRITEAHDRISENDSRIAEIVQNMATDQEVVNNFFKVADETNQDLRERVQQVELANLAQDDRIQTLQVKVKEQSDEIKSLTDEKDSLLEQLSVENARTTRLEQDMIIIKAALANKIHTLDCSGGHFSVELQKHQARMEKQIQDGFNALRIPLNQVNTEVQSLKYSNNQAAKMMQQKFDAVSNTVSASVESGTVGENGERDRIVSMRSDSKVAVITGSEVKEPGEQVLGGEADGRTIKMKMQESLPR